MLAVDIAQFVLWLTLEGGEGLINEKRQKLLCLYVLKVMRNLKITTAYLSFNGCDVPRGCSEM